MLNAIIQEFDLSELFGKIAMNIGVFAFLIQLSIIVVYYEPRLVFSGQTDSEDTVNLLYVYVWLNVDDGSGTA